MGEFKLTAEEFFGGIFINCYVCALDPDNGKGQISGCIPTQESDKPGFPGFDQYIEDRFFDLNKKGWGIHFTPNGMKTVEMRSKKENISHINAWWVEIDIEETKVIEDPFHDEPLREERKAEIRWALADCGLTPSLTVETRNGFQVYWFSLDGKIENFDKIEELIYWKFKSIGADKSAMAMTHTLRVPYFRYNKHGETGFIQVFEFLSCLKLYAEAEMFDWLKDQKREIEVFERQILASKFLDDLNERVINLSRWYVPKKETDWEKISKFPIPSILERLSGRDEVKGDIFKLSPVNQSSKANVLVNGHSTPNWVDLKKNLIFSNNVAGMATIIQYLEYYGHARKEAIALLNTIIQ